MKVQVGITIPTGVNTDKVIVGLVNPICELIPLEEEIQDESYFPLNTCFS